MVCELHFTLQAITRKLKSASIRKIDSRFCGVKKSQNTNMKLIILAAISALFAASCCPSSAPAESKPTYVAPSK